jgi:hypothetical protein
MKMMMQFEEFLFYKIDIKSDERVNVSRNQSKIDESQ